MEDSIGPKLPDNFKDHCSRVIGPALPPGWKKKPSEDQEQNQEPEKKIIGPVIPREFSETLQTGDLPSTSTSASKTCAHHQDSDDEDESTIGPLLPSATSLELEELRHQRDGLSNNKLTGSSREEWMTVLPEKSSVAQKLGFGKSVTSFSLKPPPPSEINPKDSAEDAEIREQVESYNDKKRPAALIEIHKKEKKKKKVAEKPTRELFTFDPEKDLKIKKMDPQQARSIMDNAKLVNSRFYGGNQKFL